MPKPSGVSEGAEDRRSGGQGSGGQGRCDQLDKTSFKCWTTGKENDVS